MVVGVISDIAKSFDMSIAIVGYLVTAFALVYAVSTPFITIFTSQYNRFKVLLTLMVVFIIGNTLGALASNYAILIVSRVMTAMVAGSIISLIMTFATTIAPMNKRAGLISWLYSGFSIASIIGIPIGTTISTNYGWRNAFWLVSVVAIMTFIALIFILPRDTKQVKSTLLGQLTLLKDSRIYVGVFAILGSAAAIYGYYTYIRPILTDTLGFSLGMLNILLFALGITSIIGNQLSGRIADKSGITKMPQIFIFEMFLLLIMPFALNLKSTGLIVLLVVGVVTSLLGAPMQVHFLGVAEKDYPQSLVLASSLSSIFFNFGISLGSATAAALLGIIGLQNISFIAFGYALLTFVLLVVLNKILKRNPVRESH
ncbi:arabinose efflux permease [Paucilactobacillus oligofermentans DSM 15707 = LMG 22743]|uniref:Arabinose efflux permease n=2 Tax=Paucilactobacillus oligofermentans TaxID=293371 RepID=A0A0R1RGM0_9LACO|nr:arabinose efflux permease [Paucilactobacillus oligofermentans DSM 15707 = LMG 22743]